MKNVIVLLIDSVFSDCIGNNKTQISSTPFIDTLKTDAIFAPNVYSYGPYTDAASKALYCGTKTLDDYGYFFGLNTSEYTHFRLFKENGFKTIGLYYPYYLLDAEIEKNIDCSIYTSGFKYVSVWGGKFEYYAKQKQKRELTQTEYRLLIACMEMTFSCWTLFYKNIEKNVENSAYIIKGTINHALNGSGKEALWTEIESFHQDPRAYMDRVLELGMEHPLAKINEYDYGTEKDFAFVQSIYKKHRKFFRRLSSVNIRKNFAHNPIRLKKAFGACKEYLKTRDKTHLRYFGNYGMLLFYNRMMKKRSLQPRWQDMASLNKQIEGLFHCLDARSSDESQPFYASIHALEPHHNMSFFSYDSFDMELIDKELAYVSPLLKDCGKKFGGNLIYQVSLRYVDLCIKRLFEGLEKRNLLNDTTVVLVSDHGSSYFFNPTRTHVVNTFHRENYNVPLLIWSKDLPNDKSGEYLGHYCSDDVLPTLCDIMGIEAPAAFTGHSILRNTAGREYIITEYMGPGVPDMLERDVWISIRSKKFVLAYKNSIAKDFVVDAPFCVYDLEVDPLELKQITLPFENEEIKAMQDAVKQRFLEIQEKTKAFLAEKYVD